MLQMITKIPFFGRTIERLLKFSEGQLILGGDFNVPLLPNMDTSSGSSSVAPGVHKQVAQSFYEAQLIDVWRLQHLGEKDYTFYAPPHNLYSCIDYLLISHAQLQAVHSAAIGTITWSDHAPIELIYRLSELSASRNRFWRLSESLLQTPEILEDVKRELGQYFQINKHPDCDIGILREAHKAVIRGVLIKHGARLKRQRLEKLTSLLHDIQKAEAQHKHAPNPILEQNLFSLHKQVTDLLRYQAKTDLQQGCRIGYESGDKRGRKLARSTREQKLASYAPQITTSQGQKVMLPKQITQGFRDFYSSLYNLLEQSPAETQMEDYINI